MELDEIYPPDAGINESDYVGNCREFPLVLRSSSGQEAVLRFGKDWAGKDICLKNAGDGMQIARGLDFTDGPVLGRLPEIDEISLNEIQPN